MHVLLEVNDGRKTRMSNSVILKEICFRELQIKQKKLKQKNLENGGVLRRPENCVRTQNNLSAISPSSIHLSAHNV